MAVGALRRGVVDAHLHLFDAEANHYGIFDRRDPGFESFVGNYATLPRRFLVDDYLAAAQARPIAGIVWHEFISEDPVREVAWAQALAAASTVPMALVGLVDFADPGLAERLERYRSFPSVTAVRQHLGWDSANPLRCFARRPDMMLDPVWLAGLQCLEGSNFRCGLDVFAPQLPDLLAVVRRYPRIGFTVAVMGWPTALDDTAFAHWRSEMLALGRCDNTCASISAVECIFGMGWKEAAVMPWLATVLEAFGPKRCMVGSHLPISGLSHGFAQLYDAYDRALVTMSEDERDAVFRRTAAAWFRVADAR